MEDSAKISARMEINMGKTVFMFPGQGAQYIGMAKDISAGAVMFATIISVLVGIILFGSKLI